VGQKIYQTLNLRKKRRKKKLGLATAFYVSDLKKKTIQRIGLSSRAIIGCKAWLGTRSKALDVGLTARSCHESVTTK
jgi:hypothetical protein